MAAFMGAIGAMGSSVRGMFRPRPAVQTEAVQTELETHLTDLETRMLSIVYSDRIKICEQMRKGEVTSPEAGQFINIGEVKSLLNRISQIQIEHSDIFKRVVANRKVNYERHSAERLDALNAAVHLGRCFSEIQIDEAAELADEHTLELDQERQEELDRDREELSNLVNNCRDLIKQNTTLEQRSAIREIFQTAGPDDVLKDIKVDRLLYNVQSLVPLLQQVNAMRSKNREIYVDVMAEKRGPILTSEEGASSDSFTVLRIISNLSKLVGLPGEEPPFCKEVRSAVREEGTERIFTVFEELKAALVDPRLQVEVNDWQLVRSNEHLRSLLVELKDYQKLEPKRFQGRLNDASYLISENNAMERHCFRKRVRSLMEVA